MISGVWGLDLFCGESIDCRPLVIFLVGCFLLEVTNVLVREFVVKDYLVTFDVSVVPPPTVRKLLKEDFYRLESKRVSTFEV